MWCAINTADSASASKFHSSAFTAATLEIPRDAAAALCSLQRRHAMARAHSGAVVLSCLVLFVTMWGILLTTLLLFNNVVC